MPAFLRASATGCHWLEMDVVLTGDGHVVVSHEPWMDHLSCIGPDGSELTEAEGRKLNLHTMPLEEIQRYVVRPAKGNGRGAHKPTLAEVTESLRHWSLAASMPMPGLNIEIKSDPEWYGLYQPQPARLAEAVLKEIHELRIEQRCLVQCFDPAVLDAMHRQGTRIPLALLIDNMDGLQTNLGRLGFKPAYYSAPHLLVTGNLVEELHGLDIRLLAWTVNGLLEMQRMIDLGVDGLITDKPAEAMRLVELY